MRITIVLKLITTLFVVFLFLHSQTSLARVVTYGQRLCHSDADLSCTVVQKGDTWVSLWSDPAQREMAMRINRTNTYLYPGMQLVVPDNMNESKVVDLLPFPQNIGPQDERTIIVSTGQLAWAAYDIDGRFLRWGPASTGKGFCPDINQKCTTPHGTFTIYRKEGEDCISTKYPVPDGGAPMPYCMFFKGGFALHGSSQLPGYNSSHGCVRIFDEDAQWLNEEFVTVGNTKVVVRN